MEHEFSICQENIRPLKAVFNIGHTSHGEVYKNCAVFEQNLYANSLKYYVGLWSKSEIVGFPECHSHVAIVSDDLLPMNGSSLYASELTSPFLHLSKFDD